MIWRPSSALPPCPLSFPPEFLQVLWNYFIILLHVPWQAVGTVVATVSVVLSFSLIVISSGYRNETLYSATSWPHVGLSQDPWLINSKLWGRCPHVGLGQDPWSRSVVKIQTYEAAVQSDHNRLQNHLTESIPSTHSAFPVAQKSDVRMSKGKSTCLCHSPQCTANPPTDGNSYYGEAIDCQVDYCNMKKRGSWLENCCLFRNGHENEFSHPAVTRVTRVIRVIR